MYKKWNVKVNGVNHVVEYDTTKRNAPIIIDGEGRKFKQRVSLTNISFIDELLLIDGKEVHLVLKSYKPDLAVDGVYLDSGEKYEPAGKNKNIKVIFLFLGLLPMLANLLWSTSTYDIITRICVCCCLIVSAISVIEAQKVKLKNRIAISSVILIAEYFFIISALIK